MTYFSVYSFERLRFSEIKTMFLEKFHTDFPSVRFSLLKLGIFTSDWVQNCASKETGDSRTVTSKQECGKF